VEPSASGARTMPPIPGRNQGHFETRVPGQPRVMDEPASTTGIAEVVLLILAHKLEIFLSSTLNNIKFNSESLAYAADKTHPGSAKAWSPKNAG
jgi:hypothetical protein